MRLAGGIDEAGYGPKLGPMTVGAFSVLVDGDNFDSLHSLFSDGFPVAVRDSKTLFSPKTGLRQLEETALVLLGTCWRKSPESAGQLLGTLCPGDLEDIAALPWYDGILDMPLPLEAERSRVEDLTGAAADLTERSGVSFKSAAVKLFTAARLNSIWQLVPNKQAASLAALEALLPPLCGDVEAVVAVDQQGGRRRYSGWLGGIFDQTLLEEERAGNIVLYRLPELGLRVQFETSADARHPTVAAASVIAKYVRELLMSRYCSYWREQGVEPSDGYGGRYGPFVEAARPHLRRMGRDIGDLLRTH